MQCYEAVILLLTLTRSFFVPNSYRAETFLQFILKFDKWLLLKQKLHSDIPCFKETAVLFYY